MSSTPRALFARSRVPKRSILLGAIAPVSLALTQWATAADKPVPPNFTINSDLGTPVYAEGLEEGFINAADNETTPNPKNSSPELGLRMAQITTFGDDLWANNRTWIYTGQVFTGPNGILSFAFNNDDTDWLRINGVVVLNDNAWDTAAGTVTTGLTPNTWVDFEYRVGDNGAGGAGPSGQNINGAANWNTSTGAVFSYVDETDLVTGAASLDAAAYDRGRPQEPVGGGPTVFRYQRGLGFDDDLRVTASGTITIDGTTAIVTEPSLRFENAAAATLTVNDGTGTHKTLAFSGGTTLATTQPISVAGTSDVRLGRVVDGALTGVRLIASGAALIIDNVDAANPNDLDGTTLEAGAGGRLVIRGSNNVNPVASTTNPLTISGAGGIINIGSASTPQTYNKAILANESGTLEHTTNTADTIGSATQGITVAAGKTLTVKNSANTLTIAGNLTGDTVANDGTSLVKYTGNANLTTFRNVAGTAQLRGSTTLTNVNVTGGRLELRGNYTITNAPALTGGTLALLNASNSGTLPNPLTVAGGNLEFVPGSIGTNSLALTGGTITLAPGITGLTGNYYNVAPANVNNQNPDFVTRESYVNFFGAQIPTTPNVLTSVGETEVLSFNPVGANDAMYARYGFTASDNIISRMEGKINIPVSGNYTFSTRSDDGSVIFLNGTKVVDNNFFQGMTTRSGSVFLEAGLQDIDIGFYEGGGGNGLEVFWAGPGITSGLLSNSVLFPDASPTVFSNPVNVQENSGINTIAPSAVVTSLTVQPGKTLTTTGGKMSATTLTLNGAGAYTINAAAGNTFTANDIVSNGAAVNITKTGTGVFAIDDLTTALPQLPAGSTITVAEGALGVLLGGATNPLGSAALSFTGGGLVLSSKGGDQTYAIPTFSGNGSIEARQIASGVAGTTAVPINVTLTGNLNVPAANTVVLGTANNYILRLGGAATGTGKVVVNGGTVIDTTGTGLQNVNLALNASGATARVEIKSNTVNLGSLASDGISTANVILGTGTGNVALNFTGSGSGRYVGSLANAGGGTIAIVKNGTSSQSLLAPLGAAAATNVSAVTVNAGTMEISPLTLGAAPITLAGGTLQMIQSGLSLRAWEADPNATGAYGALNTFAGVQSHYAALGVPAFVGNTAADGNLTISYNPGGGDANPPFAIHGYNDADTIEALFSGKIFITEAGSYKFSPRSDDGTTVYVNGQAVSLNNFAQGVSEVNQAPRDGSITLSPGYHDIVMTFNEGGGGQGMFVDITGPNGLRRTLSNSELFTTDVTATNNVNLTASSSVDARGGRTSLGTLAWTAGTTLTSVSGTAAFTATNLPAAGTYSVSGAGSVEPGTISVTGNAAVTLANTGTGSLILNNTATNQLQGAGSVVSATGGGRIVDVVNSTAGSTNPLGNAGVTLGGAGGGELVISNKVAENFSVNPTLQITGNAGIAADNAGGGAINGTAAVPIVGTVASAVTYGANTLTLRSGSNYQLQLGGAVTGTGPLNVTGGSVTTTAAVNAGAVNVSGGRLTTTGSLTAASATIGNGGALRLTGAANVAGGTTVNSGGALEVNGTTYTGGAIALNNGALEAVGGVSNLSGIVVNGAAASSVNNALQAKLFPNFVNPIGGFGSEQGLLNTLTEKAAFSTTLGARDFNFGPRYNADGPIATFFNTTPTDTNIFSMAFTGSFKAAETGAHSFRKSINDDGASFWVDLNQNGLFELTGSAGSERLAHQGGCCGNSDDPTDSDGGSANLTAGQTYKVAIVLQDTGGGSSLAARFSTPSIAETFINPGAASQAGLWSIDQGGGTIRVGDTAELTLGLANNISEAIFTGGTGILRFNNAAARTTTIPLIRSDTAVGTNAINLSANDTLNAGLIVVNDGSTIQKTGPGTLVAASHGLGTGATLQVTAGQLVMAGAGPGTGTVLASGTGTAVINGSLAGSAIADLGGTVTGTGTVGGLEVRQGGFISPGGTAVGALTVGSTANPGTALIGTGGQLSLDIASAASFDQIRVNGTATLTGFVPIQLTLAYNPVDNVDAFTILLNDGDGTDPIQGGGNLSFNGTPLGQGGTFSVTSGAFTQQFRVNYTGGDGNDLVLQAVPEPGTIVTLLGGMGALLGLQRFRRRRE